MAGIVAFLLAVGLGAYRNYCKYLNIHLGPFAGPPIWRSSLFKVFSWIVVALSSIFAAFSLVLSLKITTNEITDFFLLGIILVVQWLLALGIGRYFGKKDVAEHNRLLILRGGQ